MDKVGDESIAESIRRLQVLAGNHEQLRHFLWDAWAGCELQTWAAIGSCDLTLMYNPFGLRACRDELAWSVASGESQPRRQPPTTLSESP